MMTLDKRTTIQTVTVIRPLKVCALLCLVFSIALLIASLLTKAWIKLEARKIGLIETCSTNSLRFLNLPNCFNQRVYVRATIALLVLSILLNTLALFFALLGLISRRSSRKYLYYRVAMYGVLLSILLSLSGLIVFPTCFYVDYSSYESSTTPEFDWSYGLAWGAVALCFCCALLLICDKGHEEIYYKEKAIYSQPAIDFE